MVSETADAVVVKRRKHAQPVACDQCSMVGMCRAAGLPGQPQTLERIVSRRVPVRNRRALVEAGQPFDSIYAVVSGALKTVTTGSDGQELLIDLHLPGELVGVEALRSGSYGYTVRALEDSSVCHLRFSALKLLGERYGHFQQALIEGMSEKLNWSQWLSAVRGTARAEQAVARFLLGLSLRYGSRGLSADSFRLPVTRQEIASYLGLAMETVSRSLARIQDARIIAARGRHVRILDADALRVVSAAEELGSPLLPG